MTGYGAADGVVTDGRLQVEIRTVNHRHLSIQLKLPHRLQRLESDIKERIRQRIARGHVNLTAGWLEEPPLTPRFKIDLERAQEVVNLLTALRDKLGLPGDIDLGFVARQPQVITAAEDTKPSIDSGHVMPIIDAAIDTVLLLREREGETLGTDLERCLLEIDRRLTEVEHRAPERVVRERERLRDAVAQLTGGSSLEDSRLAQEIALLADRIDVNEEVVRLRAHLAAARDALVGDGPVGKHLGFLAQEMLREINTIGSKANDAAISHEVIAMKGELERFREQIENVE